MSNQEWTNRGKTIAELVKELQSFEGQSLEVRISLDGGATSAPISLVGTTAHRGTAYALLRNSEDQPSLIHHGE